MSWKALTNFPESLPDSVNGYIQSLDCVVGLSVSWKHVTKFYSMAIANIIDYRGMLSALVLEAVLFDTSFTPIDPHVTR